MEPHAASGQGNSENGELETFIALTIKIPDPDFLPSRIPDTESNKKDEAFLFCSYKFQKISNYFNFERYKKIEPINKKYKYF
jgi:hypothetical protein